MNKYKVIIITLLFGISCSKNGNVSNPEPISAVNIVNAAPNSSPFIVDLTGATSVTEYFSSAQQIDYGSSYEYSIPSGQIPTVVYQISDTNTPAFIGKLLLSPNAIYSIFLAGNINNQGGIDTLLVEDFPPNYSIADSVAGVRFVNLSTGSKPMNVTIEGNPVAQTEFTGLSYKNVSSWKGYPATSIIPGYYSFTVWDQSSGDSLTSFTWNYTLFRNSTLVISGSTNGNSNTPLQVFQMNNF